MTRPTSKSKSSPAKAETDTKPKAKTSAKVAPAPSSKSSAKAAPKAAEKAVPKGAAPAATKPEAKKPEARTAKKAEPKAEPKKAEPKKAEPKKAESKTEAKTSSKAAPKKEAAEPAGKLGTKTSAKAKSAKETPKAMAGVLPTAENSLFAEPDTSRSEVGPSSVAEATEASPVEPVAQAAVVNEPFKHVTFEALIDDASLLEAVHKVGWKVPTPVQAQALPLTLTGRDVCAFAQTGTGKTAVIAITAGAKLLASEGARGKANAPAVLIVVPTRELAEQVEKDIRGLLGSLDVASMSCFGGTDVEKDKQRLAGPIDVVVATPGRLLDHHKHKNIQFDNVSFFVCDEADRMFDMGFIEDIEFIMKNLPAERVQKLMTSATGSEKVRELAFEYLEAPEYIESNPEKITPENIKLVNYAVPAVEKFQVLLGHIKTHKPTCAIVFTNTKVVAEWVGYKLACNGIRAEVLTGDIPQAKRMRLVQQVKNGEIDVLVATDVLSRGLHVSALSHVYNFDIPDEPESFVHRVGRTARAGADGSAISVVCEDYGFNMGAVEKLLGFTIPVEKPEAAFYALEDVSDYPFDDQGRVKSISQAGQGDAAAEVETSEHPAAAPAGRGTERSHHTERHERSHRGDRHERSARPERHERHERPERGAEAHPAKRDRPDTPRVERGNEVRPERQTHDRNIGRETPAAGAAMAASAANGAHVRNEGHAPQRHLGGTHTETPRPAAAASVRTPIEGLRYPNRAPVAAAAAGAGAEGDVETSTSRRPDLRDVRDNREGREFRESRPMPRKEETAQPRTETTAPRADRRPENGFEVRTNVREGRVEGRPESMRRPESRDLGREGSAPRDTRPADANQPRRSAMPLGVGGPRAAGAPNPNATNDRRPERDAPRRDERARETVEEALAAARAAAERRRAVQSVEEFTAAQALILNAGERIGEAVGFVQAKVTETIEKNAPILSTFLERFRAGLRKGKQD